MMMATCDANGPTIEMVTVGSPHGIHLRNYMSALMLNTRLAVAQIMIVKVCSPALQVWNKKRHIAVYSMRPEDYGDRQCPSSIPQREIIPSARNSPMRRRLFPATIRDRIPTTTRCYMFLDLASRVLSWRI